ncbi:MAG: hypothetical protein P0111_04500 [Nitrospira sp.]|nr:hypothetical protein [Nitrospira sp.]
MTSFIRQWVPRKSANAGLYDLMLAGHTGRRNILILTEHLNATYYISFDIPLRRLHLRGAINFAVVSQQRAAMSGTQCWIQWAETFCPDIVVMSRYGLPFGMEILAYFRQRAIPVIYHLDDDLLEIPESLGREIQERQGNPQTVECRRRLIQESDLVYASTAYLAALVRERFPTQYVIHGIYAPYLGDELPAKSTPPATHPVIGYMGSKGHQADLDLAVPAIARLLDERPHLAFEVFGTIQIPSRLLRFEGRVRRIEVRTSYVDFLRALTDLGWDIGLAPLADIPFNRCKAPTKFIEYSACGIPIAASNMAVYGEVVPKNGGELVAADWHGSLRRLLDDPAYRRRAVDIARTYCASQFAVSTLEDQLASIFDRTINERRSHAC